MLMPKSKFGQVHEPGPSASYHYNLSSYIRLIVIRHVLSVFQVEVTENVSTSLF
jgi:hypothetical protein